MVRSRHGVLTAVMCFAASLPLAAQRPVALTGKPQVELKEPFSRIGGVREVPGNKAIVLDAQDDRVVMADFAAGTVRELGRKGGGPGEFQRPTTLLPGPGNVTWIPDFGLSKVHVVSPDGKFAESGLVPPQAEGMPIAMIPRAVDRMGRFYIQGSPRIGPDGQMSDSIPVLRWTPGSNKVDTLARVPSGMKVTATSSGNSQSVMMRSKPYSADDIWAVLPDGRVAVIHATPYRVDIIDGKVVHPGTAVSYTPIKVTSGDRDAYRKQMAAARPMTRTFGGGGGTATPPPSMGKMAEVTDAEFPAVKPPFAAGAVKVSPEGEIWVLRSRAFTDQVPTYDIFDGTGRLVAKATLNANSTVAGFGSGTIYIARTDPDDDLMYIQKYLRSGSGDMGAKPLGGGNK